MHLIEHMTQTAPDNCVSTCLAMLVNLHPDDVTAAFHRDYFYNRKVLPSEYLAEHGIMAVRHYAEETPPLSEGAVHVVVVPSLNIPQGLHQILLVEEKDGTVHVLDPNVGREGRLAYTQWPLEAWWRVELTVPALQIAHHRIRVSGAAKGSDIWRGLIAAPMVAFEQQQE